ncbi:MAG TPA: hypothetical protein VFV34_15265 [Blastocatellia bacterium]|nr:hypothetical protein [Blastocatellia bacterium]
MEDGAIGFRVKSGWAVAVLLSASGTSLRIIDRRRVQLADPAVEDSAQPYHAALELPKTQGGEVIARLVKSTTQFASRSIGRLLQEYRALGFRLLGAGIVVGSDADPAAIKNDHIRAHAEEGRLFRVVIEAPLKDLGLNCSVTPEKKLFEVASTLLGRDESQLKGEVTLLGKAIDGPWRAEDKCAALAAWIELKRSARSRRA